MLWKLLTIPCLSSMWQETWQKDGLRGQFYAKTTVRRSWKWYARAPVPCQNSVNIFSGQDYLDCPARHFRTLLVSSLMQVFNGFYKPYYKLISKTYSGFEAPTTAVFGLGNRTAAVRIPAYVKDPSKVRIEFRTIDATTNPYLDLLPWFWLVWTEYVVAWSRIFGLWPSWGLCRR